MELTDNLTPAEEANEGPTTGHKNTVLQGLTGG